ncbi:hypothetical protein AHiyo6_03280 [Arthrobacter sp. Hiyo6]|nr:hypothetical protein AHiyo6_03280 [Arthrobacter sp. Hiyo6]
MGMWRPRRLSDLVSDRNLYRTRTYCEGLRPLGINRQISVLAGRPGMLSVRAWTVNRLHQDFTDEEVDLARTSSPWYGSLRRPTTAPGRIPRRHELRLHVDAPGTGCPSSCREWAHGNSDRPSTRHQSAHGCKAPPARLHKDGVHEQDRCPSDPAGAVTHPSADLAAQLNRLAEHETYLLNGQRASSKVVPVGPFRLERAECWAGEADVRVYRERSGVDIPRCCLPLS